VIDAVFLEPAWAPGLELARKLHERNPKLPMVFESVEPGAPVPDNLQPLRYLLKPFGLRELEQAIEAALAA
jgi:two-component SAPR family response regulator